MTELQLSTEPNTEHDPRLEFLSPNTPRWCPGCGCFAVLKSLTATYAQLGVPREKLLTISGIGCTSRLPYYTRTFGFHTVHGRAPTIAMGAKLTNPDLSVWLISGDGDALAIGGNHTLHFLRRNPDIKMLMLNNQIYGLTKGQASPTSPLGQKTKSSPFGVIDTPLNPINFALAAGATFVARVTDTNNALMESVFAAAHAHRGVAFVEVLLNCVTFNDGVYSQITSKATRADHSLLLAAGEPLRFGSERQKYIVHEQGRLEVVECAPDAPTPENAVIHDPTNLGMAQQLALMTVPELPCAIGIFRQVCQPVYGELAPVS